MPTIQPSNQRFTSLPKELPQDLNSKPSGTPHGTQKSESFEPGKDSPLSLQNQDHASGLSDTSQKQNFFEKLSTNQKIMLVGSVAFAGALYLGSRPAKPKDDSSSQSGQKT
jgi:hypothetical protein